MSKFDIATEMNGIIASPVYQNIFAKPQLTKTAASKEDDKAAKEKAKAKAEKEKAAEKAKAEKEKAAKEKAKAKEKADKEKAKAKATKKKAMTKYESCVYSLCKASEILDEAGLGKASSLALLALDDLVKTAAKKKEEKEKGKKKEEDKKAVDKKKKEDAKKKEDKADAKGLPPWLKGKKDKKDEKKDVKKVKKASNYSDTETPNMKIYQEIVDELMAGDLTKERTTELLEEGHLVWESLSPDEQKAYKRGSQSPDSDDNKDFEELMAELEEPEGEADWAVLNKPDDEIDIDDPEIESLVEGIEDSEVPEEGLDSLLHTANKKSSLQKLAEELSKGFLA